MWIVEPGEFIWIANLTHRPWNKWEPPLSVERVWSMLDRAHTSDLKTVFVICSSTLQCGAHGLIWGATNNVNGYK